MKSWQKRPPEIANLLNPAFCSIILHNSIKGYQSKQELGMPFPLIFVILPIILHPKTREILPSTTNKNFYSWLREYPQIYIGFSNRAKSLVRHTKESVAFGIKQQIFQVNNDGRIILVKKKKLFRNPKQIWSEESDSYQCYSKANFVGKWFTKISDVSNIFVALGIRP